MITLTIIKVFMAGITALFSIVPNVPATPEAIVTAAEWVITTIQQIASVFQQIYSPSLLSAIVVMMLVLFNFERIYFLVLWVLKKIPAINIK
jgi:hypothetical protein